MPNATFGAKRYLIDGMLQQQQNEIAAADNTRRANMVTAEAQLAITTRHRIESDAKVRLLSGENAQLQEENGAIKDAVFELVRERRELYSLFAHLAQQWGKSEYSAEDIKAEVDTRLQQQKSGARMVAEIEAANIIASKKAQKRRGLQL